MIDTAGRTPLWTLVAVAIGAVAATLVLGFIGLRLFAPAPRDQPVVAGVTAAATPPPAVVATPPPAVAVVAAASPVASGAAPSSACAKTLSDAQSLGQAGRWSDAAAALEVVKTMTGETFHLG